MVKISTLVVDMPISFNYTSGSALSCLARFSPRYPGRMQKMEFYNQMPMTTKLAPSPRNLLKDRLLSNPMRAAAVVVVLGATFLVADTRKIHLKAHWESVHHDLQESFLDTNPLADCTEKSSVFPFVRSCDHSCTMSELHTQVPWLSFSHATL